MFGCSSSALATSNSTPHALVVDDDRFVLATICAKLEKMGVSATACDTVASATRHVSSGRFSFAIVDLGLPDGDGSEIIAAIRRSKLNANTPVIIVTANKNDEVFMKTLSKGGAIFVSQKPIDWACLEYVLEGTVLEGQT